MDVHLSGKQILVNGLNPGFMIPPPVYPQKADLQVNKPSALQAEDRW